MHIHVFTNVNKEVSANLICSDSPFAGQSDHKSQTPNTAKDNKGFALLRFEKFSILKQVYSTLKKHNSNLMNEDKKPFTIKMVFDSRCIGKTKWCGVVLRHLPDGAKRENIKNIL